MEQLKNDNQEFLDSDKMDGGYYIGTAFPQHDLFLLDSAVNLNSVLTTNHSTIVEYLLTVATVHRLVNGILCSYQDVLHGNGCDIIQIMKLQINKYGQYTVILLTHYFRLFQRRWRQICNKRK